MVSCPYSYKAVYLFSSSSAWLFMWPQTWLPNAGAAGRPAPHAQVAGRSAPKCTRGGPGHGQVLPMQNDFEYTD